VEAPCNASQRVCFNLSPTPVWLRWIDAQVDYTPTLGAGLTLRVPSPYLSKLDLNGLVRHHFGRINTLDERFGASGVLYFGVDKLRLEGAAFADGGFSILAGLADVPGLLSFLADSP
jgi:hypothetical protein